MRPLFLVGYMGCGKSTIGRKIARRLGVPYVDTDALVEEVEGATVYDIFRYEGEERFRQLEREALERVIARGAAVVATGGGLPMWQDNMTRMNEVGLTVYLRRSAENIASRLSPYGRQKRPRLRGLNDEELVQFMRADMASREAKYAEAALILDCEPMDDDTILEALVKALKHA
ncbi:MAG: shikimate kinase [Alistipes sp.]|nr:shikimate kinase [Alistipes sp.]